MLKFLLDEYIQPLIVKETVDFELFKIQFEQVIIPAEKTSNLPLANIFEDSSTELTVI